MTKLPTFQDLMRDEAASFAANIHALSYGADLYTRLANLLAENPRFDTMHLSRAWDSLITAQINIFFFLEKEDSFLSFEKELSDIEALIYRCHPEYTDLKVTTKDQHYYITGRLINYTPVIKEKAAKTPVVIVHLQLPPDGTNHCKVIKTTREVMKTETLYEIDCNPEVNHDQLPGVQEHAEQGPEESSL